MQSVRESPRDGLFLSVRDVQAGLWRLADPKIGLASFVPFVCGTALAWKSGATLKWAFIIVAYLAVFAIEVGKNAVNDLVDFHSGVDQNIRPAERSPFSGGKRVLVDGLLDERDLLLIAFAAFGIAAVAGTIVAMRSDPRLLLLGAAGAAISILYSAPPLRLSYHGLGELVVGLTYGPAILLGSFFLQAGAVSNQAIRASIIFGILIANVLLLNEFPDERADRSGGKRTLVVRLGRPRATTLVGALSVFAFSFSALDPSLWGILAGVPTAVFSIRALSGAKSAPPVLAQAMMLASYVLSGAGLVAVSVLG